MQAQAINHIPVVACADLAQFVGTYTVHCLVVGLLVVLDGDLGSHATHGMDTTLMAGLNEEFHLCRCVSYHLRR